MEAGDYVVLNSDIDIGAYASHGLIIKKYNRNNDFEILFADGVIENYRSYNFTEISEKEYFKLQLGARWV